MSDHSDTTAPIPSQAASPPHTPQPTGDGPGEMLSAALLYRSLGWSPIPLCDPHHTDGKPAHHDCPEKRRGKVPMGRWRRYCDTLPTEKEIRSWWRSWPNANVGIAFGPASGLFGVDVDDAHGAALLAQLLGGDVPETLEFATPGGGRRFIFRAPAGVAMPIKHHRTEGRPLSLLSHGTQTVMPPSLHLSGRRYCWPAAGGPQTVKVAEASPEMVRLLLADGEKKRPTGGGVSRPDAQSGNGADPMARARAYCDACPPAIEDDGGDLQTWKVAVGLARMGCLTPSQVYQALADFYNPRCKPPWPENLLRRKAEMAVARHHVYTPPPQPEPGPRLAQTEAPRPGRGPGPGRGPAPADRPGPAGQVPLAIAGNAAPKQPAPDQPGRGPGAPALGVYTPPRGDGEPEPLTVRASALKPGKRTFLLEPYFAHRNLHLVAGRTGIGKTHFTHWVMSRARRTVYLPGKETDYHTELTAKLAAAGVDPESVEVVVARGIRFPSSQHRITQCVKEFGADLLLLDPASSYLGEGIEENNNPGVRACLESLTAIAADTGCCVVAVHHPGKAAGNTVRGAAAWKDVPRCVYSLGDDPGTSGRRMLSAEKYYYGTWPPRRYYAIENGPGGCGVFRLQENVDDTLADLVTESREREEGSKIELACEILTRILASGEQEAKTLIGHLGHYGIQPPTFYKAAKRLNLAPRGEGQGGDYKRYYTLPPNASNPPKTA